MTDEEFTTLVELMGSERACNELFERTISEIEIEQRIEEFLNMML